MDPLELARDLVRIAVEKKAENVVILDVRAFLPITDYFVILTGTNRRQVAAISDTLIRELKRRGAPALGSDGVDAGRWALIDGASVIVHLFSPEAREYYDLEGLWGDAPRIAPA